MPLLRGSDTGSHALQDGDSDDSDSEVSSDSNTSGLSSDSWMLGTKDEPWWGLGSTVRPRVGCGCLDFFGQSSFHHYFESLQHSECMILIIQCQAGEKKRRQCPLFWVRTQATFTWSPRVFVQALHQEPILKYLEHVSRAIPIKIAPALPALPKSQKGVLK